MPLPTPNGLLKVIPGTFEEDPLASDVNEFAEAYNVSIDVLDEVVADVVQLKVDVAAILDTGITQGILYGGTY